MTIETPSRRDAAALPPLFDSVTDAGAEAPLGLPDGSALQRLALRRPALWSSIPAAALMVLVWSAGRAIGPRSVQPLSYAPSSLARSGFDGIVRRSQTLVVAPIAGHTFLRGKLTYANAVAAQSPIAGRIARVMVHAGQNVQLNEPILSFANDGGSEGTVRAQRLQSSAEEAQVDAVNQKSTLQERMQDAQARLLTARQRVDAAQHRVDLARDMVARLERGEEVSVGQEPASDQPSAPSAEDASAGHAQEAAARAATARRDAERAEIAAHLAQQRLSDARERARAVGAELDDKGDVSDLEMTAAKQALQAAESANEEAVTRADNTRQDAARLQAVADAAANADVPQPAAQRPVPSGGHRVTVAEAADIVHAAVAESAAADQDVQRITDEIDSYGNGVATTKERLDATGQNLDHAQQIEQDAMISAGLATVRAPTSGIVLQVASPDTEVQPGQPVVTVGQPGQWEIRVQDYTDNWQKLKPGDNVTAVLQTQNATAAAPGGAARSQVAGMRAGVARGASSRPLGTRHRPRASVVEPGRQARQNARDAAWPAPTPTAAANASGAPAAPSAAAPIYVSARIKTIKPPMMPGEPAVLEATMDDASVAAGHLYYGMDVTCLLDSSWPLPPMAVPSSALLPSSDGHFMVVVLNPLPDPTAAAGEVPCRVEYREVVLGNDRGLEKEVTAGLSPGERIALYPRELQTYREAHGTDTIVRLQTL